MASASITREHLWPVKKNEAINSASGRRLAVGRKRRGGGRGGRDARRCWNKDTATAGVTGELPPAPENKTSNYRSGLWQDCKRPALPPRWPVRRAALAVRCIAARGTETNRQGNLTGSHPFVYNNFNNFAFWVKPRRYTWIENIPFRGKRHNFEIMLLHISSV